MEVLKTTTATLIEVIKKLPDEYYTARVSILDDQTIGQQIRHIAEHWQILLENYDSGCINYSARKRDKVMESNKNESLKLLMQLQIKSVKKDKKLSIVSIDGQMTFDSTYFRETDHITEHIIHHAAIIKMAILSLNTNFLLPLNFGYAPSTIAYKNQ